MGDLDYNEYYRKFDLEKDPWTVVGANEDSEGSNFAYKSEILKRCGLKESSTLLDIGCGTGLLLKYLQNYLISPKNYVGIDISSDAIEFCKKHYPNSEWYTCEMTKLPTMNRKFDAICLFSVFTHMYPNDIIEFLKEMKIFLNKDGCIVASVILNQSVSNFIGDRWKIEINKEYFFSLVRSAGFFKIEQPEPDEFYSNIATSNPRAVIQVVFKIS